MQKILKTTTYGIFWSTSMVIFAKEEFAKYIFAYIFEFVYSSSIESVDFSTSQSNQNFICQ